MEINHINIYHIITTFDGVVIMVIIIEDEPINEPKN